MNFVNRLIQLPRGLKQTILVGADILSCLTSVLAAFYLRIGEWVGINSQDWRPLAAYAFALAVAAPIFWWGGLYQNIVRFFSLPTLLSIVRIFSFYALIYGFVLMGIKLSGVPRTIGLIQPLIFLILLIGSRFMVSLWLSGSWGWQIRRQTHGRTVIYGANRVGLELVKSLKYNHQIHVMALVDDDPQFVGQILHGVKVYPSAQLEDLVARLEISDLILAKSELSRQDKQSLITRCSPYKLKVRVIPAGGDLLGGKLTLLNLRELDIADLLGRQIVSPDLNLLRQNNVNDIVLVSGAGGSIGSELCRQILSQSPKKLILFDVNEFNLYQIHLELINAFSKNSQQVFQIVPILGSITDKICLDRVFNQYKPQTVFHAAAYKHVPLVEENPFEGIRNNIYGTLTLCEVAMHYGVKTFTLISTDKAVRPTNIMGATKRIAELILQAFSGRAQTVFSIVRFGNVLNSSGSVVPLFKKQIQEGGPITLTDQEVTRYFMTITEAAQLVIQASAMAKGGEIFLLDMGESVRIYDLAVRMIELSGLTLANEKNPNGDIEIEITGLRPGEKLYEELLIDDSPQSTANPLIMKAQENFLDWDSLKIYLESLNYACENANLDECKRIFAKIVMGYPKIDLR